MTREERRALLGDAVIEHIHELVAATPEPGPELISRLRLILAPAAPRLQARKAAEATAPASDAA
jgi:hypothetical protein